MLRCGLFCNTAACCGSMHSELSLSANTPANNAANINLRSKFAFPTRAQMARLVRHFRSVLLRPSSLEIRLQVSQSLNYPAF